MSIIVNNIQADFNFRTNHSSAVLVQYFAKEFNRNFELIIVRVNLLHFL
jgi:hypothetical protein